MEQPKEGAMNAQQLLEILPHRYPFIFVDGILEREGLNYAVGFKNVSLNEPYVYGKSTANPRLPESLIAECMAQVGAAALLSFPEHKGKIMLFAAIDKLRFYRAVYPGECLISRVQRVYQKGSLGKMKAIASVNGNLVAEGELSFALSDPILTKENGAVHEGCVN